MVCNFRLKPLYYSYYHDLKVVAILPHPNPLRRRGRCHVKRQRDIKVVATLSVLIDKKLQLELAKKIANQLPLTLMCLKVLFLKEDI